MQQMFRRQLRRRVGACELLPATNATDRRVAKSALASGVYQSPCGEKRAMQQMFRRQLRRRVGAVCVLIALDGRCTLYVPDDCDVLQCSRNRTEDAEFVAAQHLVLSGCVTV